MNFQIEKISRIVSSKYLLEKMKITPLFIFLALFLLYDSNFERYLFQGSAIVITIVLLLIIIKTRRILVYLFIIVWLLIVLSQSVFVISNKTQDLSSDRDDAVELAASQLIKGQNPWLYKSLLGLPITTGPTSILIAVPSVIINGKINILTFIFWILFFSILMGADIYNQNNSFIYLFLLFLLPALGFQHTIIYSLEELYYLLILLPFLITCLNKRMMILSGIVFSALIFSRLSYIYLGFGIISWMLVEKKWFVKDYVKIFIGFLYGTICISIPFLLISGSSIIDSNFIINSIIKNNNVPRNQIFNFIQNIAFFSTYYLNQILINFLLLTIIFLFSVLIGKSNQSNPYWNISFASLVAFTIIFTPLNQYDYILSVMIPLFFGVSFTSNLKL